MKKFYTKDFDDNILSTDIDVILERVVDGQQEMHYISFKDFASSQEELRALGWRRFNDDPEESYQLASDYMAGSAIHPGPTVFFDQIEKAIAEGLHSPSAEKFVQEVLLHGETFAINTARGNSMDTIKHGIMLINDSLLSISEKQQQLVRLREKYKLSSRYTDDQVLRVYFDDNVYLPVNNKELCKILGISFDLPSAIKKVLAQDWYISHYIYHNYLVEGSEDVALGFSDDSMDNIEAMLYYFLSQSSSKLHGSQFHYRLYYTGRDIDSFTTKILKGLEGVFTPQTIRKIVFTPQYSTKQQEQYDIMKISL